MLVGCAHFAMNTVLGFIMHYTVTGSEITTLIA